jgi:hypothetical protein
MVKETFTPENPSEELLMLMERINAAGRCLNAQKDNWAPCDVIAAILGIELERKECRTLDLDPKKEP